MEGFVEKNKDTLFMDLDEAIASSTHVIVRECMKERRKRDGTDSRPAQGFRHETGKIVQCSATKFKVGALFDIVCDVSTILLWENDASNFQSNVHLRNLSESKKTNGENIIRTDFQFFHRLLKLSASVCMVSLVFFHRGQEKLGVHWRETALNTNWEF